MARIDSKVLFLTTSPRTPEKMIPEIELLVSHFAGNIWNLARTCKNEAEWYEQITNKALDWLNIQ